MPGFKANASGCSVFCRVHLNLDQAAQQKGVKKQGAFSLYNRGCILNGWKFVKKWAGLKSVLLCGRGKHIKSAFCQCLLSSKIKNL